MTSLADPSASTGLSGPSVPSEDDLLALVARGDCGAFAALYDRTAPRLLGLVTQCMRDPSQAEEVTQEVYLELWRNAARFDGTRGTAFTWMRSVARNRAIDGVRASQSSRDRDLRVGIRDQPAAYDVVSETVETRVDGARVRLALQRISAVQREAIELAYSTAGPTQTEMAEHLGVKVSTIKTRLRGGLIALRRELAEPIGQGPGSED